MSRKIVRFGVAMEAELLEELDALATARGCTRSELLRDLARNEVSRANKRERVPAVAAVTLVYNHHVRQLSERLTTIQHSLGEAVRSTMHVHLDSENCLETIVMRGRSDQLHEAAERMLATRGVSHGSVEIVTEKALRAHHQHEHDLHGHDHAHDHEPEHTHASRAVGAKRSSKRTRAT
jgi:CopG family transcriptional regulator, nickel-responsive regulator